jgi:hypothetical protein
MHMAGRSQPRARNGFCLEITPQLTGMQRLAVGLGAALLMLLFLPLLLKGVFGLPKLIADSVTVACLIGIALWSTVAMYRRRPVLLTVYVMTFVLVRIAYTYLLSGAG